MRPAVDTIFAPPFPRSLPWINTEQLRVDKQLGRPLVIAFWDSRRAVSVRPLLELERWHREYGPRGARIIAVHVDGDSAGTTVDQVRATAQRHGITLPIVVDEEFLIANAYGLNGVPSRYTFDQGLKLIDAHFGLGGFADGEQLIRALVEHGEAELAARKQPAGETPAKVLAATPATEPEQDESCDQGASVPIAKQPRLIVHPPAPEKIPEPVEDAGAYVVPVPGELLPGDFRGPYEAGAVWGEFTGMGTVQLVGGEPVEVPIGGLYLLAEHGLHAAGTLDFTLEGDLACVGLQLEPGV